MTNFYKKLPRSSRIALPVGAAALVLVGIWAYFASWNSRETALPRRGRIIEAVYGIGTVTARREYHLKLGVPGVIQRIYAREGERIPLGAALVKIADTPTFRAPFAGVVTSLPFYTGETVFPGPPLLTLTDLTTPYLEVALEQEGALRVKPGQDARFSFESMRGIRFSGRVLTIYPRVGQFRVRIEPKKLPANVLPGMTADVAIEISRKENALLIPLRAVYGGMVSLFRGKKNRFPRKVRVEIGGVDGEWAEVLKGDIRPEDRIIIGPKKPKKEKSSP